MEHLLSMGFSEELSSQALSATGGASAAEAADWILSHHQPPTSAPPRRSLHQFFPSSAPQNPKIHSSSDSFAVDASAASPPPPKRPKASSASLQPLAERMRPRTVDEVLGQEHILGPGSVLRSALNRGKLPNLILWGPPGTGKTSISRALSASSSSPFKFVPLSAVTATVKDVRDVVEESRRRFKIHGASSPRTVLFLDEVHRFSRAQQDAFLPAIEDGSIVFVGATTENPSFHLTTALLSRCRVLALNPLQPSDVAALLRSAAIDVSRGLPSTAGAAAVSIEDEAVDFLALNCDGDARVALNSLELAATIAMNRRNADKDIKIAIRDATEAMQSKHLAYDRAGEEHYNLISALHKSMRGSDADAAVYWLARMLEGGEQPLYIARRLVRFAGEDIGLADPSAIAQAVACYQACNFIGMPECEVNLAQCVCYLALAPKSVAVYRAINKAKKMVKESAGGNEKVPLHLRNAPTKMMKDLGYGKDYLYPPDHSDCASQTYLPHSLLGHKFLEWPPAPQDQNFQHS